METLILLIASGAVSLATQLVKHFIPVNPLFVVAGLSVLGGLAYATLVQAGYWGVVRDFALIASTGAVAIHQVLVQVTKK